MKVQFVPVALLMSCLLWLVGPATAQGKKNPEIPIVVKFQVFQMTDAQAQKIKGKKLLSASPAGRLLSESYLLTATDSPSLFHTGEKWPIVYFDPRAEQFQLQYVDIGLKLDVNIKPVDAERFALEVRSETSKEHDVEAFDKSVESFPGTVAHVLEAAHPSLSFGETLVLSRVSGSSAQAFLESEGLGQGGSNFICTISLERP